MVCYDKCCCMLLLQVPGPIPPYTGGALQYLYPNGAGGLGGASSNGAGVSSNGVAASPNNGGVSYGGYSNGGGVSSNGVAASPNNGGVNGGGASSSGGGWNPNAVGVLVRSVYTKSDCRSLAQSLPTLVATQNTCIQMAAAIIRRP
jgi:hypothetical protein